MSLDAKFDRLKALLPNWDTYGAPSIAPSILAEARAWLDSVHVIPCSDGGVQLEWHRNDVDVEVTFRADATVEAWASDPNEPAGI